MTHPSTEQARKRLYSDATGRLIEERLNRSTRPTEGRESGRSKPLPNVPFRDDVLVRGAEEFRRARLNQ